MAQIINSYIVRTTQQADGRTYVTECHVPDVGDNIIVLYLAEAGTTDADWQQTLQDNTAVINVTLSAPADKSQQEEIAANLVLMGGLV